MGDFTGRQCEQAERKESQVASCVGVKTIPEKKDLLVFTVHWYCSGGVYAVKMDLLGQSMCFVSTERLSERGKTRERSGESVTERDTQDSEIRRKCFPETIAWTKTGEYDRDREKKQEAV